MEDMRTYANWVETLEQENKMKVIDPDGMRAIIQEGKQDRLMNKEEANYYFLQNTVMKIRD